MFRCLSEELDVPTVKQVKAARNLCENKQTEGKKEEEKRRANEPMSDSAQQHCWYQTPWCWTIKTRVTQDLVLLSHPICWKVVVVARFARAEWISLRCVQTVNTELRALCQPVTNAGSWRDSLCDK
jgi:hypothetical protein